MSLDSCKNFTKVIVSIGYNDTDTAIVLSSGEGAKLPDPSTDGEFNLVWYNSTDYPDPADDPNVEIVRVTAKSTDTLTVTRAQEGTSASTKNTAGKTYRMILSLTKKMIDDIGNNLDAKFLIGDISADSDLDNEVLSKNVNSSNLLLNGAFKYWYSGTSSAPDGWEIGGGGSVARESTEVPDGYEYSMRRISGAGGNDALRNSNWDSSSFYTYFQGKTVTFSCWVHADTADSARLEIDDGVGSSTSSYHSGGGSWELLTVTHTVNTSATRLIAYLRIIQASDTAYFTGAQLNEGSIPFAYTDNPDDIKYNSDLHRWDSGIIDTPNQSGCSVYLSANQSITAGERTKLEFDTKNYDTQNEFDSSTNYRFTATKAGKYLINLSVDFDVYATGDNLFIYAQVNGGDVIQFDNFYAPTNGYQSITSSKIVNLSAGDYIEAQARNNDNDDTIFSPQDKTFLTISKIQ